MRDAIQMMTIPEFWEFAQLPENRDKRWELINGDVLPHFSLQIARIFPDDSK